MDADDGGGGEALWTRLAALAAAKPEDEARLSCERLELVGGATLDVYKAERAEGAVTLWRVRGFFEAAGSPAAERQAAVLGTKDGRAIVRFSEGEPAMLPVSAHHPTTRALGDLSEVVAAAVRRLMDGGD